MGFGNRESRGRLLDPAGSPEPAIKDRPSAGHRRGGSDPDPVAVHGLGPDGRAWLGIRDRDRRVRRDQPGGEGAEVLDARRQARAGRSAGRSPLPHLKHPAPVPALGDQPLGGTGSEDGEIGAAVAVVVGRHRLVGPGRAERAGASPRHGIGATTIRRSTAGRRRCRPCRRRRSRPAPVGRCPPRRRAAGWRRHGSGG